MTFNEIKSKAYEMAVPLRLAINRRITRLLDELDEWEEMETSAIDPEIILHYQLEMIEEIADLRKCYFNWESKHQGIIESVSAGEVEQARRYPINKLVEFERRWAKAPCHEDHHPSLYWDKAHNRAHCFVCGRKWNPIDWLIEFEGKDFITAVRDLQG